MAGPYAAQLRSAHVTAELRASHPNAASTRSGPAGAGVPKGGDAGQVLAKRTDGDYDTEWSSDLATAEALEAEADAREAADAALDGRLDAVEAPGWVTSARIADGTIVHGDIAPANLDGTAGTPSLRTLGPGAQQAAPGNDARLTDARPPTGAAGGVLSGTYPNPGFAADMATQVELDALAALVTAMRPNQLFIGPTPPTAPQIAAAGGVYLWVQTNAGDGTQVDLILERGV